MSESDLREVRLQSSNYQLDWPPDEANEPACARHREMKSGGEAIAQRTVHESQDVARDSDCALPLGHAWQCTVATDGAIKPGMLRECAKSGREAK